MSNSTCSIRKPAQMVWTCLILAATARGDEPALGGLRRAGALGVAVAAVPEDVRTAQKLDPGVGVQVRSVLPGSSAAAELRAGDVITAVDATKVADLARFLALVGRRKAGETLAIDFVREGQAQKRDLGLRSRPLETGGESYDVVYDSVASRGGRLRTILTRPKAPGKHPALFLIQGLGSFSIESIPPNPPIYSKFIEEFARRGYVTLRVDKPGQGDSEGGPTRDVDFETELDGYRQALRALVALDYVDKDNVLIFGHSMGGVMGPLIAVETPVRGIAAYGTVAKTWYEYLLENTRRQMALAGDSAAAIDDALRADVAIHHQVFIAGQTPEALAGAQPALRDRTMDIFQEGLYLSGRHFGFFRQLAARNLPKAWADFGGHALAIWGRADFVSTEADHALIAATVNRARPGFGTFLPLEGTGHGFDRATSPEESYRKPQGPGEFNPAVLDALADWASRVTGQPVVPR